MESANIMQYSGFRLLLILISSSTVITLPNRLPLQPHHWGYRNGLASAVCDQETNRILNSEIIISVYPVVNPRENTSFSKTYILLGVTQIAVLTTRIVETMDMICLKKQVITGDYHAAAAGIAATNSLCP
jgi:hypothetical protein